MLGLGITNGRPQACAVRWRSQPTTGTTESEPPLPSGLPSRSKKYARISPSVSAWRMGSGSSPTNERNPSRCGAPSSVRGSPEMGFGRSRTSVCSEQRRPDVRVVAGAHVREIDDEQIDLGELLARRYELFAGLSVEADDAERRFGDLAAFDGLFRLRVGIESVLGREHEANVSAELTEHGERVATAAVHRGGVSQHAHARFAQAPRQAARRGEVESCQQGQRDALLTLRGSLRGNPRMGRK